MASSATAVSILPRMKVTKRSGFVYDMRLQGWTLIQEGPKLKLVAFEVELADSFKEGEPCIGGEVLRDRAREMEGCANGQHLAERLLAKQKDIPKEWRGCLLLFPETIWQDPSGNCWAPYLYWNEKWWVIDFIWLGRDLNGSWLVRLCKPTYR